MVESEKLNIRLYNSFFFQEVEEYGIQKVFDWDKKKPIFNFDYLFIPKHINIANYQHWICYEIQIKEKKIIQYDSLSTTKKKLEKARVCLKKYLFVKNDLIGKSVEEQKEYKKKLGDNNDISTIDFDLIEKKPSEQKNGYDCGIFMIYFILFNIFKKPIKFKQEHITNLRKYLLHIFVKLLIDNKILN